MSSAALVDQLVYAYIKCYFFEKYWRRRVTKYIRTLLVTTIRLILVSTQFEAFSKFPWFSATYFDGLKNLF